ncbi:MAG TPA: hypothetical protein VF232_14010 [Gaiellaceae bacterium]
MAPLRDRIRPALYDFFGGRMERHFAAYRRRALAHAQGRVLEIGGGTGFNVPYYPRPLVAGRALAHLIVLLLATAALAAAPDAQAHGGTRSSGYVSTFSNLDPNVLGVLVNVIGSREFLRVSNYSGKTLVVLGYQREPYLRFTRSGVYENSASPTAYLNASHTVPQSAAGNTEPRWKQVSRSPSYTWHDHRIVWTGAQPPPAVQESPDETHLIFNWRIPARVDGRPFRIKGFLGWSPPPATQNGGGTSTWLIVAAAVGGALLLAAAAGAGVRHAKRRTPKAPV